MWKLTYMEVYIIGRLCYFNVCFNNGLNPSGNIERFAYGFPIPIGNDFNFTAHDYDTDVTFISIPAVISSEGELLISKSVEFQHDVLCSGIYLVKS